MAKPFELVVISGKGGTGKTSVAAGIVALAGSCVIADCDVDAADMHILLSPKRRRSERFMAGRLASISPDLCVGCGACLANCRFGAVVKLDAEAFAASSKCNDCDYCKRSCPSRESVAIQEMRAALGTSPQPLFAIDPSACEGCGVCVRLCPAKAVGFDPRDCGELLESETRFGPMTHAALEPGGENSGKLVAAVKERARRLADGQGLGFIVVDGPPGVGCPVIASVSGASLALLVAEPTASAKHDLMRAIGLLKHFGVPGALCVNRWDVNPEMASEIESAASKEGIIAAGRIRYDKGFSLAQIAAKALTETESPAAADLRSLWASLMENQALRDAAGASNIGKGD